MPLWAAALLPLAFWPAFEDAFKLPQAVVASLLAAWAIAGAAPDLFRMRGAASGALAPVAGVVALLVCSAVTGPFSRTADVVWGLALAGSAVLLPAIWRAGPPPVPAVMAAAGVASAAYSLVQYFLGDLAGDLQTRGLRPFSTMGNPDFLAAYLVAVLPWLVSAALRRGGVIRWGAAATVLAALLLAQSRGAWLGMAAAGGAGLLVLRMAGGSLRPSRRARAALGLAAVAIVLFVGVHRQGRERLGTMFATGHFDAAGRFLMWRVAAGMIRERPLAGGGPGSFAALYPEGHARAMAADPTLPWFYSENAHSDALQVAAELGLLGLGLVAWACTAFVRLAWRARVRGDPSGLPLLLGFTGLAVDGLFNFPWYLLPTQGWFWLSYAWLAARHAGRGVAPAPLPRSGRLRLAAAGLAALAAGWFWSGDLRANGWLKRAGDLAAGQQPREALECARRSWSDWRSWEGRDRVAAAAAVAAYGAGDLPTSEGWARAAIKVTPSLPAPWSQLGLSLARQGRLAEAEAACRAALALNPRQAEAWQTLGNIRYLRHDRAGAAEAWKAALAANPALEGARNSLEGLKRRPSGP